MSDDFESSQNLSILSLQHIDSEVKLSHLSEQSLITPLVSGFNSPQFISSGIGDSLSLTSLRNSINFSSTCASIMAINQPNELQFLHPASSQIPIVENSIGGQFLRKLCEDPKPVKTYTAYLRKESVNLFDECDSAVVMQIVQKEKKTKAECDFLLKAIRNLHIFQKNKDILSIKDCNEKLFNSFRVEHIPAKKAIFNYGDFGQTYYIVLSGEADLLIPYPTNTCSMGQSVEDDQSTRSILKEGQSKEKVASSKSKWNILKRTFVPDQQNMAKVIAESNKFSKAKEENYIAITPNEPHENYLKRQYPTMNLIKTFKAGESFGEIALMTKQRRTGTVVSRNGVNMMTLNKECFDTIMGSYCENIVQRNLNFFKSFYLFRGMPDSKLMSLMNFMKVVQYRNKNIVYTEGDPSRIEEASSQQRSQVNPKLMCDRDGISENSASTAHLKPRKVRTKRIPLVIKSENSYFGEEEILSHTDLRKKQAVCSSEKAEIYLLKKDILYNYTRGYSVIDRMKEEVKVKCQWNDKRTEEVLLTQQSTKVSIEKNINQIQLWNSSKKTCSPYIFSKENQGPKDHFNSYSPALSISKSSASFSSGKKRLSIFENKNESFQVSCFEKCFKQTSRQQQQQPQVLCKIENEMIKKPVQEEDSSLQNIKSNNNYYKLTPENRPPIRLNNSSSTKKRVLVSDFPTSLNSTFINSREFVPSSKLSTSNICSQEENAGELKSFNSSNKKKYDSDSKQTSICELGNFSIQAFVNQVGQNVEHKMQVLKKLKSNSSLPQNSVSDIAQDFGLSKRPAYLRSLARGSLTPCGSKESGQRAHSGLSGKEFQQEILKQQRYMQSKNLLKRKPSSLSQVDESLLTLKRVQSLTRESFSRASSFNEGDYPRRMSKLNAEKSCPGLDSSLMVLSHRSLRSQCSDATGSQMEKSIQKPSSQVLIKDLHILEEVPESNSPVKNRRILGRQETQDISSRSQVYFPPERTGYISPQHSFITSSSQNFSETKIQGTEDMSYACKAFLNRNQTSLKKKVEAKRGLSKNTSIVNSNEKSFRISSVKSVSCFSTKLLTSPPSLITSSFFFPSKQE